jgi:protein SCO1/2
MPKKIGILFALGVVILAIVAISVMIYINRANTSTLGEFGTLEPFTLDSTTGEKYYSDNGKVKLLTFFLINCPDSVCPLTMQDFTHLQEELKKKGWFGEEVELVSITFDPARDDMESIREYSQYFKADPEGWHFLRGEEEEIAAIAEQLNYVYSVREDGSAMHAATMYLLDGQNRLRAYHKMSTAMEPMDKEKILQDIASLVREAK